MWGSLACRRGGGGRDLCGVGPRFHGDLQGLAFAVISNAMRNPSPGAGFLATLEMTARVPASSPMPSILLVADETAIADTVLYALRRSEEHTSELQSLMRTSYAVFCLK